MASRRGFSLIELLVVIGILLVLATAAAWGLSGTRGADRSAAGARVLQAQLLGARDRASQAREVRGVRLLRDSQNAGQLVGVARLQPAPRLRYGGIGSPFQLNVPTSRPPMAGPTVRKFICCGGWGRVSTGGNCSRPAN